MQHTVISPLTAWLLNGRQDLGGSVGGKRSGMEPLVAVRQKSGAKSVKHLGHSR